MLIIEPVKAKQIVLAHLTEKSTIAHSRILGS